MITSFIKQNPDKTEVMITSFILTLIELLNFNHIYNVICVA